MKNRAEVNGETCRYEKASADYKQSADAVANAIQVLQQYYSQGSFAQVAAVLH